MSTWIIAPPRAIKIGGLNIQINESNHLMRWVSISNQDLFENYQDWDRCPQSLPILLGLDLIFGFWWELHMLPCSVFWLQNHFCQWLVSSFTQKSVRMHGWDRPLSAVDSDVVASTTVIVAPTAAARPTKPLFSIVATMSVLPPNQRNNHHPRQKLVVLPLSGWRWINHLPWTTAPTAMDCMQRHNHEPPFSSINEPHHGRHHRAMLSICLSDPEYSCPSECA